MKQSNKMIFVLVFLFISGLFFTDYLLKLEYGKINLADQLKNYEVIKTGAFNSVYLRGGNGYAIKILQGKDVGITVMKTRKGFLKYAVLNSVLTIDFNVPGMNISKANQPNVPVGLIITCPSLSALHTFNTYNLLDSLHLDSLAVSLAGNSFTRLRKSKFKYLSITSKGHSYTELHEQNRTDVLSVNMMDHSFIRLNDTRFQAFLPIVKGYAELLVCASFFEQAKFLN